MGDPRLNSLHLEPVRRENYRRARDLLLGARGAQTLIAERKDLVDSEVRSPTVIFKDGAPNAPEGQATFRLVDREFVYPLKIGVNTLGRSSDNDVVSEDAFVSRRHCAILVHHNGTCEVHDTASKNGTYVNGNRIAGPVVLKSGDEIRISNQRYTFFAKSGNPDSGKPDSGNPHVTLSA
jgi:hypothetical protein